MNKTRRTFLKTAGLAGGAVLAGVELDAVNSSSLAQGAASGALPTGMTFCTLKGAKGDSLGLRTERGILDVAAAEAALKENAPTTISAVFAGHARDIDRKAGRADVYIDLRARAGLVRTQAAPGVDFAARLRLGHRPAAGKARLGAPRQSICGGGHHGSAMAREHWARAHSARPATGAVDAADPSVLTSRQLLLNSFGFASFLFGQRASDLPTHGGHGCGRGPPFRPRVRCIVFQVMCDEEAGAWQRSRIGSGGCPPVAGRGRGSGADFRSGAGRPTARAADGRWRRLRGHAPTA